MWMWLKLKLTPELRRPLHTPCKESSVDSPGLVDFAIGQVNSVFNLLDGQVMFS